MQGRGRQFAIVVAGLLLALVIVIVRLLVDARSAYQSGMAAEQSGDTPEAIRHYLDAARLYVPGSPFVRGSLDRLEAMGTAAVTRGDYGTARSAYEAERAALLGARSFYIPYAKRLPDTERRLARLLAATEQHGELQGFETRAAWHAERLAQRPWPRTSLVLLCLFGLGTWISSAILFFRKGLDVDLRLKRVPAILTGIGFAVGFAVFLVCLRLA
jgi:hypothetical protein